MRFKLIAGFVNPEITEKVVKTAKNTGATGEVILQGKGGGMEQASFMGLSIHDKTDIVLFVVEEHHVDKIIKSVTDECSLEEPGNGIIIVLSIDKVAALSNQIRQIRENLNSEEL